MAKDRARKRALKTIFTELGLKAPTYRQRMDVMRWLRAAFKAYAKCMTTAGPSERQLNEFQAGVEAHSGELIRLLTCFHPLANTFVKWEFFAENEAEFAKFVDRLRTINEAAKWRIEVPKGAPPKDHVHSARLVVVAICADLYTDNGKSVGAGRISGGGPDGPFVRLVHAALMYVGDSAIGEKRGHDAVLTAIKAYQARLARLKGSGLSHSKIAN